MPVVLLVTLAGLTAVLLHGVGPAAMIRDVGALPVRIQEDRRVLAETTGAPLFILTEVGHIPRIEAPAEFQAMLIAATADLTP